MRLAGGDLYQVTSACGDLVIVELEQHGSLQHVADLLVLVTMPRDDRSLLERDAGCRHPVGMDDPPGRGLVELLELDLIPRVQFHATRARRTKGLARPSLSLYCVRPDLVVKGRPRETAVGSVPWIPRRNLRFVECGGDSQPGPRIGERCKTVFRYLARGGLEVGVGELGLEVVGGLTFGAVEGARRDPASSQRTEMARLGWREETSVDGALDEIG